MLISIGQFGLVTGQIDADTVQIDGRVNGTIRAGHVILSSTAQVFGDIHHEMLTIEMGANFEGNMRRTKNNGHRDTALQQNGSTAEVATAAPLQSVGYRL